MKDLHLTVPATAGWGSGLARVPEGADVDLDLRLESVVEGVLVSGIARAHVDAECARCLEPVAWDECADIQELFVYPPQDARDIAWRPTTSQTRRMPRQRSRTI
jgi:uncharacterized protein